MDNAAQVCCLAQQTCMGLIKALSDIAFVLDHKARASDAQNRLEANRGVSGGGWGGGGGGCLGAAMLELDQ